MDEEYFTNTKLPINQQQKHITAYLNQQKLLYKNQQKMEFNSIKAKKQQEVKNLKKGMSDGTIKHDIQYKPACKTKELFSKMGFLNQSSDIISQQRLQSQTNDYKQILKDGRVRNQNDATQSQEKYRQQKQLEVEHKEVWLPTKTLPRIFIDEVPITEPDKVKYPQDRSQIKFKFCGRDVRETQWRPSQQSNTRPHSSMLPLAPFNNQPIIQNAYVFEKNPLRVVNKINEKILVNKLIVKQNIDNLMNFSKMEAIRPTSTIGQYFPKPQKFTKFRQDQISDELYADDR